MREIYEYLEAAEECIQARCNSTAPEQEALENLAKAVRLIADKVDSIFNPKQPDE